MCGRRVGMKGVSRYLGVLVSGAMFLVIWRGTKRVYYGNKTS